jgi:hypothetical protein
LVNYDSAGATITPPGITGPFNSADPLATVQAGLGGNTSASFFTGVTKGGYSAATFTTLHAGEGLFGGLSFTNAPTLFGTPVLGSDTVTGVVTLESGGTVVANSTVLTLTNNTLPISFIFTPPVGVYTLGFAALESPGPGPGSGTPSVDGILQFSVFLSPEIDPGSAATPVALSLGLLLLAADRRRKIA